MIARLLARIPGIRRAVTSTLDQEELNTTLEQHTMKAVQWYHRHNKPKGFSDLRFVFKDDQGRSYYEFKNDFDVYIKRRSYWEERLIELDAMLSHKELDQLIEACLENINKAKPDYAFVAHILTEMKMRKDWLVHGDILYDLLSACYVREDEDPRQVDEEIHEEKLAYFKEQPDAAFFFENRTINTLLPFLKSTRDKLPSFLKNTQIKAAALRKQVEQYTSVQE